MAGRGLQDGFAVDDTPLRNWILKAYHGQREDDPSRSGILEALRQFLSGPLGTQDFTPRYWFEDHPTRAVGEFVADLETHRRGISRLVFDPLFAAVDEAKRTDSTEIAPNVGVYVASLAGPLAIKSDVDETMACALLSAALLGIARLGVTPFRSAIARGEGESTVDG